MRHDTSTPLAELSAAWAADARRRGLPEIADQLEHYTSFEEEQHLEREHAHEQLDLDADAGAAAAPDENEALAELRDLPDDDQPAWGDER